MFAAPPLIHELPYKKRGGDIMAFDTTALVTAIAEGRVNEDEARALLSEAQELEVKIAKLLTPKEADGNGGGTSSEEATGENIDAEPIHEPTPEELAQPEVPTETASVEPQAEPAPTESEVQ